MEEKNKQSLQRALKQLPRYEPPELVWTELTARLEAQEGDRALHEAIRGLRTYEPPESVWTQIDRQLDQGGASAVPRLRRLYTGLAAAAAVLVLLIAGINLWSNREASPRIAYAVEERSAPGVSAIAVDWNADEELIGEVVSLLEESPRAIHQPAYQTLREELDELNEAKEELEMIMNKYGTDAGTIRQLKEIELERTTIIKEMAEKI